MQTFFLISTSSTKIFLTFFTSSHCLRPFPPLNQISMSSFMHSPVISLLMCGLFPSSSLNYSPPLSLIASIKPRPSFRHPAPLIRGHCCFSLIWVNVSVCRCLLVRMCVKYLFVSPFLCLLLSTRGNHIVTAYFGLPTQPLFIHFFASLALFHPFPLLLFLLHFTVSSLALIYLSVFLNLYFRFACCLPLSFFLPSFLPPLPSSLLLSLPFCPKFCSPAGMVF